MQWTRTCILSLVLGTSTDTLLYTPDVAALKGPEPEEVVQLMEISTHGLHLLTVTVALVFSDAFRNRHFSYVSICLGVAKSPTGRVVPSDIFLGYFESV